MTGAANAALWGAVVLGGVLALLRTLQRRERRLAIALSVTGALILGLAGLAAFGPEAFPRLMQEDGPAEWATVLAFGAAALLWGRRARSVGAGLPARAAAVLLAAFCLFVAGEELSWGQRLFGFQPPEVFLAENYQQEFNVHNFLKGREVAGLEIDTRWGVALVALAYGLLLPLVARWSKLRGWAAAAAHTVAPTPVLAPTFAAVALAEVSYPVPFTGEASELVLGLVFLAAASVAAPGRALGAGGVVSGRPLTAGLLLCLPLIGGWLAPPLVDRLVFGPDREAVALARAELARLAEDLRRPGVLRARLLRKRRVHKRVFTAVRAGYLGFGRKGRFLGGRATPAEHDGPGARRDRLGYFLDPWNQPYWIRYESRSGRVVLYSFGPDRRRGLRFDHGGPVTREGADDPWTVVEAASQEGAARRRRGDAGPFTDRGPARGGPADQRE